MRLATLATCALNQFALDFEGNTARILAAAEQAVLAGASYLLTPELSICGYGAEDHFLEDDTFIHSVDCLARILRATATLPLVLEVGAPWLHHSVRYNVRVVCAAGRIVLIRPKRYLADDLNYREGRWFGAWARAGLVDEHLLPEVLAAATGQRAVPFGDAVVDAADAVMGIELCEELFTPDAPHIRMALLGAEIFTNASGSHHELRKLHRRIELISEAMRKSGGVYLYANQRGCDGGRLYYDGCACIVVNGALVAQGAQFGLEDVELVVATVDLDAVRSYRAAVVSTMAQAVVVEPMARVSLDRTLCCGSRGGAPGVPHPSRPRAAIYSRPEEEIGFGPACWLWDYLRRSRLRGYFLPLSGGLDSSSTATIVGVMTHLLVRAVAAGSAQVLADVRAIVRAPDYTPACARELASRLFFTCYMGTSNSSSETRARAAALAGAIGATHMDVDIEPLVLAMRAFFTDATGRVPEYRAHGGSVTESLALQNIQARLRMVIAYLFGQLLPWARGDAGTLLILGSANVDEALRGFYTKYDCSSADVNPIGGVCKLDLHAFLSWAAAQPMLGYGGALADILTAEPTPELEPTTATHRQISTEDMGMSFDELSVYGKLRKQERLGPLLMFRRLLGIWPHLAPGEVARRVKFFFDSYARHRHKMTTLTPSYHAESYSPDDNRFDHRQFLYPAFTAQYAAIDADLVAIAAEAPAGAAAGAGAASAAAGAAQKHARDEDDGESRPAAKRAKSLLDFSSE